MVKVNGQRMVNGQRLVNGQRSTTEDDVEMTSADQWMLTQLGLTWHCVEAHGGAVESLSGTWGRMRSPMAVRVPRMSRSALDDLSGTVKIEIGAIYCSDTMLEILNNCIVFHRRKNIHQCLYIGGICVRYK